jgi:membrane protease YdiL (CAAX protease family)
MDVVHRGIIQEALSRTIHSSWIVIALQALLFGMGHFFHGFPNGYLGFAMTFGGSLPLGYLRMRTKGLLAPLIFHIFIDIFIFSVLVVSVRIN